MKTKKSFDVTVASSPSPSPKECGDYMLLTQQLAQTFKVAFSCFSRADIDEHHHHRKQKAKKEKTLISSNQNQDNNNRHYSCFSSLGHWTTKNKKNLSPTIYSNTDSLFQYQYTNNKEEQSKLTVPTRRDPSYSCITHSTNSLSFVNTYNLENIQENFFKSKIDAKIENIPTRITEHENTVQFKTPNFRAAATVVMAPTSCSETWKIGWIQACTKMVFHNTYGSDGYTSWEFQELTSDKQPMISDCDGCYYPWYGARDETVVFHAPAQSCQEATIVMNDNFHPHVTWRNPAKENQLEPNLTHIIRDQSFYVWLLAWNMTTSKSYILKNIYWNMNLEIQVDPKAKLGKRARLISPPLPQQPMILNEAIPIPRCALCPPNANSAQRLVWNPREGSPMVIIPPIWNSKKSLSSQIQKYDSNI